MKKIIKLLTIVSVLFVSAFNLNAQCYTPTYTNRPNLLPEAQMDNISLWTTSWGTLSLETASPYCGTNSIRIGNGTSGCSGGLAANVTWLPNTTYRVRGWFKNNLAGKKFSIFLGKVYTAGATVSGDYDQVITGTGNWQEVDFTFTTGASAGTVLGEIAVNSCGAVTADRSFRIWVDNFELYNITTSWTGAAWSNGTPDSTVEAIIDGTYDTTTTGAFSAKKLTVNSGKSLTINSGTNVTVQNEVINNGSFVVENNANLIQVNNTTNTGNVTVTRNSNDLLRLDYTLWSSPVAGQNLASFSPLTSQSPSRFYTYNSATNLYNAIADPTATSFAAGTGYLIRMPNDASAVTPTAYTGVFTGVPNNGDVNLTSLTSNVYYAVGNPYPSILSAESFLAGNSTDGVLYFWRKTNAAGGSAYATYTAGGATSTTPTSAAPNGTIQVGQGFIVKTGVAATSLTFSNSMREASPTSTQFFKTKTKNVLEKDRVWLNLTNTEGVFSQALVGYIDGATQGVDAGIDGKYINDSPVALTSNINDEEYTIQGRALPFDASDVVPLSFKTDVPGDYTIAIDHVDGLFAAGQEVYLVDNTTGIETSLTTSSYTFTAAAEMTSSRFALKYQKTLGTNQSVFSDNNVTVYKNKGILYVNAGDAKIANIKVYDVQGKLVAELKNVKATSATITNLKATNQVLVVKAILADNKVVTRKVVN